MKNPKKSLSITIIYDNHSNHPELRSDWGFSCFVKGLNKSILFDTGRNGSLLLHNMDILGIQPEDIDGVFLSHDHRDHTGGLMALLEKNSKLKVWIPFFFPPSFKEAVKASGASLFEMKSSQKICEGAYSTGVISGWIKEQSLVLDAEEGLVIITGCAHPRIVNIVYTVKDFLKKNIYLALGGFHLAGFDKTDTKEIIDTLRKIGLKKVAPCHCTGEDAQKAFKEAFGNNFIKTGVGKIISLP